MPPRLVLNELRQGKLIALRGGLYRRSKRPIGPGSLIIAQVPGITAKVLRVTGVHDDTIETGETLDSFGGRRPFYLDEAVAVHRLWRPSRSARQRFTGPTDAELREIVATPLRIKNPSSFKAHEVVFIDWATQRDWHIVIEDSQRVGELGWVLHGLVVGTRFKADVTYNVIRQRGHVDLTEPDLSGGDN